MDTIRLILLEDDPDFAFLVRQKISEDKQLSLEGIADNRTAGVIMAKKLQPDIALIDLNLTDGQATGIKAAHEIRTTTDTKVLLLTSVEREDMIIKAGKEAYASAYIKKSNFRTLRARIHECAHSLTPEALYIKTLLLSDLTDTERYVVRQIMGEEVTCTSSPKTIANQKTSIFHKIGVKNMEELLRVLKNF